MITLKQINKEVNKVFPDVELVRGNGYFYIVGKSEHWNKILNSLKSTSIYTYSLNRVSLEKWVYDVVTICNDALVKYNRS